ncbi:MAG TPA: hypothetical protein VE825_16305 [Terriglobales bacterium]|jgi:hypothetical protein|nr:hypothetical protein [Terriglobales bacterium]
MRSRLLCLVALLLAATFLLAQGPGGPAPAAAPQAGASQPAVPSALRWAEGAKDSELVTQQGVRIEIIHAPGLDVAVSLLDLQEFATRAWVQVLNKGSAGVPLDPAKAALEIVKPKPKTLPAVSADKVADKIKQAADVDAENRSSAGCAMMRAGCAQSASGVASSKEVEQRADAMMTNVKSTALQAQTVKPGEQAQGAIFFTFERKRQESVLHIPVGDMVFEFPFVEGKK